MALLAAGVVLGSVLLTARSDETARGRQKPGEPVRDAGDSIRAMKKGFQEIPRSLVPHMARTQNMLDFPPAPRWRTRWSSSTWCWS